MPTSPEVDLICSARLGLLCRLDDSLDDDFSSQFKSLQVKKQETPAVDSEASEPNHTPSTYGHSASSTNTSLVVPPAIPSTEPPEGDDEDEWDGGFQDRSLGWRTGYAGTNRDSHSERDFTACSADDCGYCGKCDY